METQINQRRGLLILLFFTFFMVVGFDMIMPLVIGHYVNNVGLTATAVSVALAIRQFSQQGLAMIGGALADRFQVKTLISVGVFLRVLGFLTLAFSSAYGMLIAAMILIGLYRGRLNPQYRLCVPECPFVSHQYLRECPSGEPRRSKSGGHGSAASGRLRQHSG